MGFAPLLGNDRLKDNLSGALRRGRISQFYLISGPAGSGKHTLTRLLAAAAMCSGNDKPCQTCPACRKVLSGVHPDVITVRVAVHVISRSFRKIQVNWFTATFHHNPESHSCQLEKHKKIKPAV